MEEEYDDTIEEETSEEETPETEEVEEETSEETEEVEEEEEKPKEEKRSFERQMYPAVCADCGNKCEVPFKPIEGRKVYCRDCYSKHRPRRF